MQVTGELMSHTAVTQITECRARDDNRCCHFLSYQVLVIVDEMEVDVCEETQELQNHES